MDFTYESYRKLIQNIKDHDYTIVSYKNWEKYSRCVILRHDIDNDIEKALELAKVEEELGINSTFFVLVTSDFYNIFSARSEKYLMSIADCGHDIGLHFDEVRYPEIQTPQDACDKIFTEVKLLSMAIGKPVEIVSMHRPSKMILEADLDIPGLINSYGQVFFKGFKYLSDSRRRWREPVDEIVKAGTYDRLHILTHAIWYNDVEIDLHDSIYTFVNSGNIHRYRIEQENITDLSSIMPFEEVRQ